MMTYILELFCVFYDFSIQFDRVIAESEIEQGATSVEMKSEVYLQHI